MEFQRKTLWSRFKRLALGADAALDSALHEAARRAADRHERFRSMMGVFAVSGGRRFVVEFASEGLAVGLAGLLLLTAMAHSALRDADEDFVRRQPLAVTFLDRYG